jgi:hypothetical protein
VEVHDAQERDRLGRQALWSKRVKRKTGPLRSVFETLLERLFFDGPAASATGKITASANSLRSSRHHVHSAR